jgi:hypothetical protein
LLEWAGLSPPPLEPLEQLAMVSEIERGEMWQNKVDGLGTLILAAWKL